MCIEFRICYLQSCEGGNVLGLCSAGRHSSGSCGGCHCVQPVRSGFSHLDALFWGKVYYFVLYIASAGSQHGLAIVSAGPSGHRYYRVCVCLLFRSLDVSRHRDIELAGFFGTASGWVNVGFMLL